MLKMTIDNEEVVSKNNFTIKEEMLSPSSTILNNTYPKTWEDDKDYTSRFYYPKDYAKLNIQNFSITPEEAGTTIDIVGSTTLTDVDTTKESRVLSLKGQTSQTGTPTPTSPIPVNVVSGDNSIEVMGKNLLDLTSFTTLTQSGITLTPTFDGSELLYITSSGTFSSTTYMLLTNTLTIQPNTTYTLSGGYSASARLRLREYDSSNTQLSEYFDSGSGVSFTSKSNVHHVNIQVVFYAQNNVKFYPMLEKGSTSTTYEPYTGNTYPISLGNIELCKIGTYQDYIYKEDGSWYLHKEIGKIVLNGSEAWTKSSNTNVNRYYIPGTFINTILNVNTIDLISDYFTCITPTQSDAYNVGLSKLNNTSIMANFSLSDTSFDTLQKFTTWLSTHNVVVYYVLATPTNTLIEDTLLLSQLNDLESE